MIIRVEVIPSGYRCRRGGGGGPSDYTGRGDT